MDCTGHDRDIDGNCSVAEDAFWHSNMDLYYGYDINELVEVEHEPYKYWLARIVYNYKQLLLLRWECDYGEFWLDTSANSKRRCYPPGYYLQPQLKSQFEFKRPPKPPIRKDPYAAIKNVEDLLLAEEPLDQSDAVKCKNIPFKPEDAEELEAALQTLNELNSDSLIIDCEDENDRNEQTIAQDEINSKAQATQDSYSLCPSNNDIKNNDCDDHHLIESLPSGRTKLHNEEDEAEKESRLDEEKLHACKTIRHKAIEEYRSKIASKSITPKPKQFYDLGGINPERLFVSGAILEICHHKKRTIQDEGRILYEDHLCHWFAIIIENIGGRLTLRWLLSDDPKFKQGRLEMKSIVSSFVEEEMNSNSVASSSISAETDQVRKIPAKDVSFRLHYCHPSINTIAQGQILGRRYLLPDHIENSIISTLEQPHFSYLLQQVDTQDVPTAIGELVKVKSKRFAKQIRKRLHDVVFDVRRINLDKDRPLIDYMLHVVRKRCPGYLNTNDPTVTNQEVLVSTPKTTKILRGVIKHVFEPGVFLIETQTRSDIDSRVIFIYPYDSSYTVLPMSWGSKYSDCLNTSNSYDSKESSEEDLKMGPQVDQSTNDSQTQVMEVDNSKDSGTSSLTTSGSEFSPKKSNNQEIQQISCIDSAALPALVIQEYAPEIESDTTAKDSQISRHNDSDSKSNEILNALRLESISLELLDKFKIGNQLEVVHPSSDSKICSGRIRRISPPLLWIQISNDSYTVVPFNSTDIYPLRWCESHHYPLIYMLPIDVGSLSKNSKKNDALKDTENSGDCDNDNTMERDSRTDFNIDTISDKQDDINDLITESAWCTRIFFNHKCFSGPALSKGKICSLPQYVGPGPVRLVMEEVVTKVISVAYVPPRILNDLSSKNFEDLLVSRNISNTSPLTFKAKYQKRVYREELPVIINAEDVEAFCECICEHLKCCYNLFGPNLYDGDDCPGHCRGLTKSNKFMKRAIYYREKARLGEFVSDTNKKGSLKNSDKVRPNYGGRASQESTGSRCKTPKVAETPDCDAIGEPKNELKLASGEKSNLLAISDESEEANLMSSDQNLVLSPASSSDQENHINAQSHDVMEHEKPNNQFEVNLDHEENDAKRKRDHDVLNDEVWPIKRQSIPVEDKRLSPDLHDMEDLNCRDENEISNNNLGVKIDPDSISCDFYPEVIKWTVDDVYKFVKDSKYSQFATHLRDQEIDGPAFLLLDFTTLEEHFVSPPYSTHSSKEICGLSEFIKDLGHKVNSSMRTIS